MIAHRAMDEVRGFVALIAPWIAMPGDQRMHPLMVVAVLMLLLIGATTVGYGTLVMVGEFPVPSREIAR